MKNTEHLSFFTGIHLKSSRLDRNSQEFYLLQRIQDEVHRFAITFHRQIRGKSCFQSLLDDIEGIGEKRKKQLLKHFGSVKENEGSNVRGIYKQLGIPVKLSPKN